MKIPGRAGGVSQERGGGREGRGVRRAVCGGFGGGLNIVCSGLKCPPRREREREEREKTRERRERERARASWIG